jgi:hypothetical protein
MQRARINISVLVYWNYQMPGQRRSKATLEFFTERSVEHQKYEKEPLVAYLKTTLLLRFHCGLLTICALMYALTCACTRMAQNDASDLTLF